MHAIAVAVGVPSRTPAVGHDFFSTDFRALEASIILSEVIVSRNGGFNLTFVCHCSTFQPHLGKIGYHSLVLIIKGVFPLDQNLAVS